MEMLPVVDVVGIKDDDKSITSDLDIRINASTESRPPTNK